MRSQSPEPCRLRAALTMRAFIGLALPEAVRSALTSVQRGLAGGGADVKWVEPHNLHVTLKFLDEITDDRRQALEAKLGEVAQREPRFAVSLGTPGAFPSMRSPRVVWIGIGDGRDALARLAEAIEQESRRLGVRAETRPFAAHIALGRFRSARGADRLAERIQQLAWTPPPAWTATTISLFHSVLSGEGPRYSVLGVFPLGAASA